MNGLKSVLTLLTGVILIGAPAQSRAQVIFDPFTNPLINPDRWHGFEDSGDTGTSNTETSRSIQNGQFQMSLTSYGTTSSNSGQAGFASTRLRLNNPAGLTVMVVQVTGTQATAQACAANTSSSEARARLLGAFFNDGSSTGPNDRKGDVLAEMQMILDSKDGQIFDLTVFRCLDSQCAFTSVLGSIQFATHWTIGQKRMIVLAWDKPNKRFLGFVDFQQPNQEMQNVSYGALPDANPPVFDLKGLTITTVMANCTAGRTKSQMTALFDNFYAQP
jgi:hypothetical protein